MSSFDRLSHFQSIFDNFLHRPYFLKLPIYGHFRPIKCRGKMTIYGSDFQQVNLTPNGGVSPTGNGDLSFKTFLKNWNSGLMPEGKG